MSHYTLDEGAIKAFKRYEKLIEEYEKGIKPVNHTDLPSGDPTCLEHLLWMCKHCIPEVRVDGRGMSVDKYSRWLGYVQGCLISKGITTVEKERNITLPWLNK